MCGMSFRPRGRKRVEDDVHLSSGVNGDFFLFPLSWRLEDIQALKRFLGHGRDDA